MLKLILFLCSILNCVNVAVNIMSKHSLLAVTNIDLSTIDLIAHDGYPAESHEIVTDDRYIINIQRIPGTPGSIPVLIIHGLCSDSHIWVLSGKNHSLPYVLADDGFDVWLGNLRGNSYGNQHVKLSPRNPQFWKFSIDEMGIYDLPGMISYIYKLTRKKVVFIGYSLGANGGLIMNMKRHDMDMKVRLMVHLGPPIFMNSARISSNQLIRLFNRIKPLLDFLQIRKWPPGHRFVKYLVKNGCISNIGTKICEEMLLSLFNFDRVHVSRLTLKMLPNYIPDATSTMVMDHLAQWTLTGHFRPYSYGVKKNIKKYKRITPPDYDLSDINVPTVIFYTDLDEYVSSQAINRLYRSLSNKTGLFRVNSDKFSHLHFQLARNARDLVYEKIIKIIEQFY